MTDIDISVESTVIQADLRRAAQASTGTARSLVRKYGALLETRIKANASGRPGPNAPTGDYRRSWNTRYSQTGDQIVASVGTNKVQGRRLELGFVGADSLGRVYNQPPFPHVAPAVRIIEEQIIEELGRRIGDPL